MELENIVANTVLMKAKESTRVGKGRSKKWRAMLQFPEPDTLDHIRTDLVLNYEAICTKQPIGQKLFNQYCNRHPFLKYCCKFVSGIEEYRTLPNNELESFATNLYEEYYVNHPPPDQMMLPVKELSDNLVNNDDHPGLSTILETPGATPDITVDDTSAPNEYYHHPTVKETSLQQV